MIPNAWYFINVFYAFRQLGLFELEFDTIIMVIYLLFIVLFITFFILVLYSYYSNNISML